MPESAQAAEKAVALSFLDSKVVRFTFTSSATSTRAATPASLNEPNGTRSTTIALQSFDLKYTNKHQFGFGQLQISLGVTPNRTLANCTVTLRDDNENQRQWQGDVYGLVTFFG